MLTRERVSRSLHLWVCSSGSYTSRRSGDPRMHRENRKLKVRQKRTEEKME